MVNTIYSNKPTENELCPIILDVYYMLQRCPSWFVKYSHRSTNRAAHNLAKLVCNLAGDSIWIVEYLPIIDDIIQLEKLCIASENE